MPCQLVSLNIKTISIELLDYRLISVGSFFLSSSSFFYFFLFCRNIHEKSYMSKFFSKALLVKRGDQLGVGMGGILDFYQ